MRRLKAKLARAQKKLDGAGTVVQEHEAAQARFDAAKEALDAVHADLTARKRPLSHRPQER
ncbi:hypothetical protein [Streptomyces sp. NBC_01358]|uniref:hypothetical protein n=1 Tax=Streptomyces sp. NBC_01358 TaxID=2903837 RepID=UPI002E2EB87F|nr:hypothetical protein [Streptomyces sp. NBC_01358]